jgi:hypothetical protein
MDLPSLQVEYELLHLRAKEAGQQKTLINTKEINACATLVKDVTTFL